MTQDQVMCRSRTLHGPWFKSALLSTGHIGLVSLRNPFRYSEHPGVFISFSGVALLSAVIAFLWALQRSREFVR